MDTVDQRTEDMKDRKYLLFHSFQMRQGLWEDVLYLCLKPNSGSNHRTARHNLVGGNSIKSEIQKAAAI